MNNIKEFIGRKIIKLGAKIYFSPNDNNIQRFKRQINNEIKLSAKTKSGGVILRDVKLISKYHARCIVNVLTCDDFETPMVNISVNEGGASISRNTGITPYDIINQPRLNIGDEHE